MERQRGLTTSHERKYRSLTRWEKYKVWMFRMELLPFRVVKARRYGTFTVDDRVTGNRKTVVIPWWKSIY